METKNFQTCRISGREVLERLWIILTIYEVDDVYITKLQLVWKYGSQKNVVYLIKG